MKQALKVLTKNVNGQSYQYTLFPLVNEAAEVLRQVTPQFDFNNPPIDPKYLAVSLAESMVKHFGVGLSSPQIGLGHRAFAMGAGNSVQVCFNPEITNATGNTSFEEGCLTWKGLFLPIKRPERIEVRYQDFNGQWQEAIFDGLTARTYLHELDHLNGIVFTKLVDSYILGQRRKKVVANLRKLKLQEQKWLKQQVIQQATNRVLEKKRAEALNATLKFETPEILVTK